MSTRLSQGDARAYQSLALSRYVNRLSVQRGGDLHTAILFAARSPPLPRLPCTPPPSPPPRPRPRPPPRVYYPLVPCANRRRQSSNQPHINYCIIPRRLLAPCQTLGPCGIVRPPSGREQHITALGTDVKYRGLCALIAPRRCMSIVTVGPAVTRALDTSTDDGENRRVIHLRNTTFSGFKPPSPIVSPTPAARQPRPALCRHPRARTIGLRYRRVS